jgi:CubicO group peptidase (beta-lactamase class C family)
MRAVAVLGVSTGLLGCAATGVPDVEPATAARRQLDRLVSSGEVPGIQYRVLAPGGVVFAAAVGVRDVASGAPMEEATIQMAYSTTKVITAIAVLQLVERGRLDLDSPLSRYYIEHPYGDQVTIRQLLAHTSGVSDPMPLDWFAVSGESFDRGEKLRGVLSRNSRLRQPPGQKYGYSNIGYWLLEKAIEAASGQDYAEYVNQHIFGPLGIPPEAARFSTEGAGTLAVGHAVRLSPITLVLRMMTPARYWSESRGRWSRSVHVVPHGRAYGGLFAAAAALGMVLQDLLADEPRLLCRDSKALLFARQYTSRGKPAGALGWVLGELAGEPYFGKQGGGLGFHANLRIYPARRLATVLLANRTEISAGPIDARSDELDAIFVQGGIDAARD